MAILSFLAHVLGATMLLLYAVRMVRTGIERAFGSSFRKVLTVAEGPYQASMAGLFLAVILQSSSSVALLVAGFSSVGAVAFPAGLAAILGADVGAALVIKVLSLKLSWLAPALLTVGGALFLNANRRAMKQAGRIVLGLAFILIALSFLRGALDPIQGSAYPPVIADYLERNRLAAFLLGAALAFSMRSGVASVLMFVTFVGAGALPFGAGLSLVLGANLGGAALPLWATRGMPAVSRRAPVANFALRGAGALSAIVVVGRWTSPPVFEWMAPAQALVTLHILFNCALLAFLPVCARLERPFARLMPEAPRAVLEPEEEETPEDEGETTPISLIMLKRQVVRAARLTQAMTESALRLLDGEEGRRDELLRQGESLRAALADIRRDALSLARRGLEEEETRQVEDLGAYAAALGVAGDTLVGRLAPLAGADRASAGGGCAERVAMQEKLLANMALAVNVLVTGDPEHARLLLEEKHEMAIRARVSRKRRMKALGVDAEDAAAGDAHLEILSALTEIDAAFSTVAGLVLRRDGQLLETRLIGDLKS